MSPSNRSISLPIVLSSVTVPMSIALLVGWTLLLIREGAVQSVWLFVLGVVSLVTITTTQVLFGVFLVREILEVRRQTNFIDSVTHELKSPLASLRLCTETFARSGLSEPQRAELQRMMLADIDRLSVFVDDILEASRLSLGRHPQNVVLVDLTELVERCVEVVCRRHDVSPDAVEVSVTPGLEITADAAALEVILKNLIDNAIKYSDPPPQVTVSVHLTEADRIAIEIKDQGIGVPRPLLKRIFQRFYRVPREAVRSRRGTGLGLYVVSSMTRNLGGKLEAHSEGEGQGTTMRVLLPPAPSRTPAAQTAAPAT